MALHTNPPSLACPYLSLWRRRLFSLSRPCLFIFFSFTTLFLLRLQFRSWFAVCTHRIFAWSIRADILRNVRNGGHTESNISGGICGDISKSGRSIGLPIYPIYQITRECLVRCWSFLLQLARFNGPICSYFLCQQIRFLLSQTPSSKLRQRPTYCELLCPNSFLIYIYILENLNFYAWI